MQSLLRNPFNGSFHLGIHGCPKWSPTSVCRSICSRSGKCSGTRPTRPLAILRRSGQTAQLPQQCMSLIAPKSFKNDAHCAAQAYRSMCGGVGQPPSICLRGQRHLETGEQSGQPVAAGAKTTRDRNDTRPGPDESQNILGRHRGRLALSEHWVELQTTTPQ